MKVTQYQPAGSTRGQHLVDNCSSIASYKAKRQ